MVPTPTVRTAAWLWKSQTVHANMPSAPVVVVAPANMLPLSSLAGAQAGTMENATGVYDGQ
jgi:hypothetical protein